MSHRRPPLPDFGNPPVVEVALSVQFERLSALRAAYFGLLWTKFRDTFPLVEDHPPLDAAIEMFGTRVTPRPPIRFVHGAQEPPLRVWFLNQTRTELIQVQQDRLVHNWRKVGMGITDTGDYPRFEYIVSKFDDELAEFEGFVNEYGLGTFNPNQCEVTYTNHIVAGDGWEEHSQLNNVISTWKQDYKEPFPLTMENVAFQARYLIERDKAPTGRLHVSLQPSFRQVDDRPIFVLTLTARARPDEETHAGVIRFLNMGREYIVKAFASITTANMHSVWRRRDD
jgi:uncharacterized protein (TIGR04255 family)